MRIAIRQGVAVPPAQAVAAYGTPAFYEGRPTRDDIAVLEVVRHEDAGARILLEVRFAFEGSVSSAVRAVVDPAKMQWVTRMLVFPAERRTSWEVLPDHYPDRVSASGAYRFSEAEGDPAATTVEVQGDLKVHVPIVGRSVERVIVADLQRYIADEVAAIPDLYQA